MYSFTKREQIVILVIASVVVSIFGYKLILADRISEIKNPKILEIENKLNETEALISTDTTEVVEENYIIMVHISGQVNNPGLLELKNGDRINDAVELSGGLKDEADIDRINLARKVQDEEKIYIPKIGENLESIESLDSTSNLFSTSSLETITNTQTNSGKININTCTKEALITLPGIGEVTAGKIIAYREESKFEKIDDIVKVSGIGDKKFAAIKDLISVK